MRLLLAASAGMMPVRIQLSRAKGWRMPPNTVKVDRTTRWGNPFNFRDSQHCWTALHYGEKGDPAGRHAASVKAFRLWLEGGKAVHEQASFGASDGQRFEAFATSPEVKADAPPSIADVKAELRGKNLACWCKAGDPCHADVLLEIANR